LVYLVTMTNLIPGVRAGLVCGALALALAAAEASAQQAPPDEGPIITDEEFNETIPPYDAETDPELNAPLESIEEFERRLATPSPIAPADIPPAPIDSELLAPLPPLESFQVEPVQFADAPADDEAREIAYKVRLDGLRAPDKATLGRLRDQFNALSALKANGTRAANTAQIAARMDEDRLLLQRIVAAEGWYSATVAGQLEQPAEAGAKPVAILEVTQGRRYAIGDIIVAAGPTEPPSLIRDNLPLQVGEVIVAERVQGAEASLAVVLPQKGYPFAKIGQRDILLDPLDGKGTYTLPVDIGPRARFGGFATDGDLAFDAKHVGVIARFKRGELYDSRMVEDLNKALVTTGLFSAVSAEPQRTSESAGDGTEYVTVMVHQDAGPPRTIAGTAGYAAGEGFKVEGSWTHRNLFRPEGALIVGGVAGTKEQGASVSFRRANAGQRDRTFEVTAEARHSNYDAYNAYTGQLSVRLSRESTPIWHKRFTWGLGATLLATGEKDYDFTAATRSRKTFYVGGLSGEAGFDSTDSLLDPTRGIRLTVLTEPEGSIQNGFTPYIRSRLDASGYFPIGGSMVLAGRARVGSIQGASRAEIAPSRRFYAGGGGSVRGFGYQKLGPLDPAGDPLGGRSLNEGAVELRYRFGDFGVVGFVDAGQSYESTLPRLSDLRFGAGLGVRYYTNFGPMRIDVATPLNRRAGENRFNLYVSIGQAF